MYRFLVCCFACLLGSFSAIAEDNLLGEYNLILLEDYNFSGGDVQGRTYIGGDLNAAGHAVEFGSRLPNTDTAIDAVTVAGDINANVVRVLRDNNLVYGGTLNASHVELNDGNDGQAIYNAQVGVNTIASTIHADAAYYSSLTENGVFSNGTFNYAGTDDVAVFNVSADQIFAQNSNLSLNWGEAETVIINVAASSVSSSTDVVIGGGVNLNNGFTSNQAFSNVLWNFYDATSINFNSLAVKGSVLAPLASTSGGASFDGAFAAVSYSGAREFHNFVFEYERPQGSQLVQVPAPPIALIGLSALLFITLRRYSR